MRMLAAVAAAAVGGRVAMEHRTAEPKQLGQEKGSYLPPAMKKHEPIKIVQGSGGGYLYYVTLYYVALYYYP